MFLTSAIQFILSDICYITKYWNSDRFKILTVGVCCMCEVSLKESCKLHGSSVQELYAFCSTLIKEVRFAGNMNSMKSEFKKFRNKMCTWYLVLPLPTPSNLTWLMNAPYIESLFVNPNSQIAASKYTFILEVLNPEVRT